MFWKLLYDTPLPSVIISIKVLFGASTCKPFNQKQILYCQQKLYQYKVARNTLRMVLCSTQFVHVLQVSWSQHLPEIYLQVFLLYRTRLTNVPIRYVTDRFLFVRKNEKRMSSTPWANRLVYMLIKGWGTLGGRERKGSWNCETFIINNDRGEFGLTPTCLFDSWNVYVINVLYSKNLVWPIITIVCPKIMIPGTISGNRSIEGLIIVLEGSTCVDSNLNSKMAAQSWSVEKYHNGDTVS